MRVAPLGRGVGGSEAGTPIEASAKPSSWCGNAVAREAKEPQHGPRHGEQDSHPRQRTSAETALAARC